MCVFLGPEGEEGEGVFVEDFDAFGDGLGGVVGSFDELLAGEGTECTLEMRGKTLARGWVDFAAGETGDGLFAFEVEEDNEVVRENRVEEGFLATGSGDPVEEDFFVSVGVSVVFEHGDDEIVGDELALFHVRFYFAGARVIEFGEVPELLPHFEEAIPVIGSDFASLGSFPGSLYSDE